MRVSSLVAFALPIALANALSITAPTEDQYWVQNQTNKVITWSFSDGDPTSFNIEISNPDNATLNGNFSIATNVNATTEFIQLTNVTLKVGDNYLMSFVNASNTTQVYATGPSFSVKDNSTPLAPNGSSTSGSSSSSAPSSTSTSPPSSTSGTNGTGGANGNNGAASVAANQGLFSILAACGVASIGALLL